MLLTKEVETILSSKNYKYYQELGYTIPKEKDNRGRLRTKRGTKIIVKTKDLTPGSHVRVDVLCDYCGTIKNVAYKDYLKNHDEVFGDCCHKCEYIKYKNTLKSKYGVDKSFDIPGVKEKIIASNLNNHGFTWPQQNPEIYQKSINTFQEKYGVNRPLQDKEILSKMISHWSANGNAPTSKPQLKLFELLQNMKIGECKLEVPCDRCLLDIVVYIKDIKIDIEYDGVYWHKDTQRDRRRDFFIKKSGYKIIRIKGNKKDSIPSSEVIKEAIDYLISGHSYKEIIM